MNGTTVRRVALAIAAAAALTGVTACGSSDDSDGSDGSKGGGEGKGGLNASPISALRAIQSTTDKADSAKVESETTMGSVMSMKAEGALGWADGLTGNMTITYTGGQMAETMRRAGSTSMEARYLPEAYYAKMGEQFAAQAGGKHWVKYAYDDLEKIGGGSGAYMKDAMQNSTPQQSVKMLLASGDVKRVGEEKVRGVNTTHYSGTVDVAELAERGSGLSESQLADMKSQLEQAGITTETIDIWVDDEDLLVKKTERGQMKTGTLSATAYYSDYGTEVSAEEPPAGDTADFKDLMNRQPGV
ncbi:hypothetical protein ABT390_17400 [Streptomyces aurantiacus]|uniref:Putative 31.2 kDa protein in rplA-rplJ intergenic region n=1 Tax=Streptomyces aurantiacus JA 4570 TaxID=1286094 RepID=S4AEF7_9ACTN|nr:hypothetical protein [Streptomyces aurantiacus]EPH39877.1 putative 31.2 kDa protein in rplA-rplJ intergenic region [Streptomyces aurantiacus JA 4570]